MRQAEVIPVCTVAELRRLVSAAGFEANEATWDTRSLESLIGKVGDTLSAMGDSDGDVVCVRPLPRGGGGRKEDR